MADEVMDTEKWSALLGAFPKRPHVAYVQPRSENLRPLETVAETDLLMSPEQFRDRLNFVIVAREYKQVQFISVICMQGVVCL
jgi:hypothetical protein